jgi:predicted Zn-dependent protease
VIRRTSTALALLLLSLFTQVSCTQIVNPATGERQFTSMTPSDEVRIGQQEHPKVLAQFGGAYTEGGVGSYADRIGRDLARVSDQPDLDYTFTVLDSPIVNAFALPGGYVYISRGLLALANNEAEVAGVIGHEIGHVTARHTAQRYDRQMQGALGATVAQIGGAVLGGILGGEAGARVGGELGGQVGTMTAQAYVQGYSREQEFQADELGVRYLDRAGYDPQAMATFLEALAASDELERQLSGRAAATPTWFASHPRTVDRVERAIAAAGAAREGGELGRDAFLATLDGTVFGDSPDQGFVRGADFIHPTLRFRFSAPTGFQLQNTSAAVVGGDDSGRAMIFDAAQAQSADAATYLQREWVQNQQLSNLERVSVAGRDAAVAIARVSFRNQPAQAMLAAIPAGDGRVYRFIFLRQGQLTNADVQAFQASLRSFAFLSAAEAAQFKALRIRIVEVGPGDTIDSLAARMAVERGKREWLVLLNGLGNRPLRAGERVKLVVRE